MQQWGNFGFLKTGRRNVSLENFSVDLPGLFTFDDLGSA